MFGWEKLELNIDLHSFLENILPYYVFLGSDSLCYSI